MLAVPGGLGSRAGDVPTLGSCSCPSWAKRSEENECGEKFEVVAASSRSLAAMAAAGCSAARPPALAADDTLLAMIIVFKVNTGRPVYIYRSKSRYARFASAIYRVILPGLERKLPTATPGSKTKALHGLVSNTALLAHFDCWRCL